VQPEEGATYDKIWKKKEVAKVHIFLFRNFKEIPQLTTLSNPCTITKYIELRFELRLEKNSLILDPLGTISREITQFYTGK
jgi:hypothetical protein